MNDTKAKTKLEIAEYFDVEPRTIDNWMRQGILPYWKVGRTVRFNLAAVIARLDQKNLRNGAPINPSLN